MKVVLSSVPSFEIRNYNYQSFNIKLYENKQNYLKDKLYS